MIYVLECLGFLGVAVLLAAGPLLARTIEYIRPRLKQSSRAIRTLESPPHHKDKGARSSRVLD
jgi:hypothetical protein